jgi:hypothetical protein
MSIETIDDYLELTSRATLCILEAEIWPSIQCCFVPTSANSQSAT